ncbi:MAG: hypothetical protein RLZZ399_832 [Verrucomicrobiota bacterium]
MGVFKQCPVAEGRRREFVCVWLVQMDQTSLDGGGGGLEAIESAEFLKQVADVEFDGGCGDAQFETDFLVASSEDDEAEDLCFSRGEFLVGLASGDKFGDGVGEIGVSSVHTADCGDQFFAFDGFGKVGADAGLNCGEDVFLRIHCGEHDDAGEGIFLADRLGGFHAIHSWKAAVHDGDVGLVLAEEGEGFFAAAGFGNDLDIGFHVERPCEAESDDEVIVDEEDSNFLGRGHGVGMRGGCERGR